MRRHTLPQSLPCWDLIHAALKEKFGEIPFIDARKKELTFNKTTEEGKQYAIFQWRGVPFLSVRIPRNMEIVLDPHGWFSLKVVLEWEVRSD
jgi:hypothetical protein